MEAQPILANYRAFKASIRKLDGYAPIAAAIAAYVEEHAPKPTMEEVAKATRFSGVVAHPYMVYRATLRAQVKAEAWFLVAALLADDVIGPTPFDAAVVPMRALARDAAKDAATLALAADALGIASLDPINAEAF